MDKLIGKGVCALSSCFVLNQNYLTDRWPSWLLFYRSSICFFKNSFVLKQYLYVFVAYSGEEYWGPFRRELCQQAPQQRRQQGLRGKHQLGGLSRPEPGPRTQVGWDLKVKFMMGMLAIPISKEAEAPLWGRWGDLGGWRWVFPHCSGSCETLSLIFPRRARIKFPPT